MSKKTCIQTGRYPKAQKRTRKQMGIILGEPGSKEVYRQTRRRANPYCDYKWLIPKKLTKDGKWRPIKNQQYVIGTWYNEEGGRVCKNRKGKRATNYALWRMWDLKHKAETLEGKRKWESRIYVVYHSKLYILYYLICRKIHHSISGVF